jgi:Spy/CpxP family protein refolding chaperone
MRTLSAVVCLSAVMCLCLTLGAAYEAKADRNEANDELMVTVQDLNLTDEQETKIADIRKEWSPKVEEAAKELVGIVREEVEKVRAVLTPEQREKLQALKEERKEHRFEGLVEKCAHLKELDLTDAEHSQIEQIRNEFRPKIVQAMEGFRGILNDQQRKTREQSLLAGKTRREILESLNLTAAQKEKAATVAKEVGTVVREEMEKIRDVLTAEQQEKLGELKDERRDHVRDRLACAIANFNELNLTNEQKTSLANIRTEFRPKIHEAGNKLRGAVREEMGMILAVIKGT